MKKLLLLLLLSTYWVNAQDFNFGCGPNFFDEYNGNKYIVSDGVEYPVHFEITATDIIRTIRFGPNECINVPVWHETANGLVATALVAAVDQTTFSVAADGRLLSTDRNGTVVGNPTDRTKEQFCQ